MRKTILIYSIALAGFAWLLQFVQYKYQVRRLSTEIYVVLIALLFVSLGVWVGRQLTSGGKAGPFERNQKALDYLGISKREVQVLDLLARGHTNQEIADAIFVSANTVKTHLAHLYDKLEVSRRTQAVQKARELNLIP